EQLPAHIAIIMDGNGRWARQRGLPRISGHVEGAGAVRAIVTECARLGIGYLTLYSFSLENWKRPKDEVDALMSLYAEYLVKERDEIMANDVRLLQVGRRQELPDTVLRELDITQAMSRDNKGLTLCLALNYGARTEIVDAFRRLAREVVDGHRQIDDIDEAAISDALYTAGVPDPDLLVRTANERRLSNFLLWQISYAELHVTPVLWPDFRPEHLHEAIKDYAARQRRYGGLVPPG
ncbi:MAG: isoprenyl transferase, partial [Phycisphaerae bacterium]|nr:isoprenyl transferase [Phycisphaerae bacterium]